MAAARPTKMTHFGAVRFFNAQGEMLYPTPDADSEQLVWAVKAGDARAELGRRSAWRYDMDEGRFVRNRIARTEILILTGRGFHPQSEVYTR